MSRKAAKKYGPGGQYYRKRIKTPDGKYEDIYAKTLTELSEKVTLRQNQLAAASDVPPQELYFFEYAAGWFARKSPHLSPAMQRLYRDQINKVICPVIGAKKLQDVTSDDLAAVMATRAHLSRSSQKKTVMVIRQIFDAALEAGAVDRLPSRTLKASGRAPEKKRALTEKQQEQLLAAVRGLSVEPCVMLGLYTGMRREEICGLRWDSVDLEGKAPHITVRRACRWPQRVRPEVTEILKSDAASRVIPIPPQLVEYLKAIKKDLPADGKISRRYVYCNADGSAVSLSTFTRRWETIKTRSTASGHELGEKIKHSPGGVTVTLDFLPTPHILRHTYITRLILGGMDLKRVQYLAGHADPKITLQIYTDLMGHAPEDLIGDVTAIFSPGEITPELPLPPLVPPPED